MSAYQKVSQIFDDVAQLKHMSAIANWDEAVMMPVGGGEARAKALATVAALIHQKVSDPRVGDWIAAAKKESLSDPWQQRNLYWMEYEHLQATCLPEELVKAASMASTRCEQAWRHMRAENNWRDFQPHLAENIKLVRESAQIRAQTFHLDAYDVLIDEYSPGLSRALIDPLFQELSAFLPDFIKQVVEKQKSEPLSILKGPFPIAKQRELGIELIKAIGFDFNHGRLDVSHHPFCGGVPEDVRMTTRYNEDEFVSAVMGICHETGHAMYERQLPKAWLDQPVGHSFGMTIHESQSLFVEMQLCRNKTFMPFLKAQIEKILGAQAGLTEENLYRVYTRVRPGLIRVDADEVTYPLHIILRYELEKKIIAGQVTVADLPEAWNDYMQRFFGLSTLGKDSDGVMQDVHWPCGAFGYFPAYSLGAMLAAQLFSALKNTHADIENDLSHGNFARVMMWLRDHVHQYARFYDVDSLIRKATGKSLQTKDYIDHVKRRYG